MAKQKTPRNNRPALEVCNYSSNTLQIVGHSNKHRRIRLTAQTNGVFDQQHIDRATLRLAELLAQQIARDVFRNQSTAHTKPTKRTSGV